MNSLVKHFIRSVLVAGISLLVAGMVSGCASGKHGGGVGGTGSLISGKSGGGIGGTGSTVAGKSGGGIGGTGGHIAGKSGGGIGGTGGHIAGKSGGGIGGTGDLIADGGGIGGTGLQAPDIFGGGFQRPASSPALPNSPQVVQQPQTPQVQPQRAPQVPQQVVPQVTPQTQIARDSSDTQGTINIPVAAPPQAEALVVDVPDVVEPGAGVPAEATDDPGMLMPGAGGAGDSPGGDDFDRGTDVPAEMIQEPPGIIICPDMIRLDPNCQAPRPGR